MVFCNQDSGTVASFASKACKGSCVPFTQSQYKSSELSPDPSPPILNYICSIGKKHKIFYLWRPKLKDVDDDFLLELAVKSKSIIVTLNGKDFKKSSEFAIKVMTPKEFLIYIGEI